MSNERGESMKDFMGGDFDRSFENPEADIKIVGCKAELDDLLGKNNYTISEEGHVTPIKEISADAQLELDQIEIELRSAYNQNKLAQEK